MELTRPGYAVIYVILLCALAQGGSEGKEEENYRDGGALSSPSSLHNHIHRKQVYQSFSISVFSSLEFSELFFFPPFVHDLAQGSSFHSEWIFNGIFMSCLPNWGVLHLTLFSSVWFHIN